MSASWDHSVRLWDVETATATETFNHNKAIHCVGAAAGGQGLVAFGGAERALRVCGSDCGWCDSQKPSRCACLLFFVFSCHETI